MKKLPKCAFCGDKLRTRHSGIFMEFDIIGRPVVGWHESEFGVHTSCATEDKVVARIYKYYLMQEKYKMDNDNPMKIERLPTDFRAKVVDLLRKIHKRGKGRIRMHPNKFWKLNES